MSRIHPDQIRFLDLSTTTVVVPENVKDDRHRHSCSCCCDGGGGGDEYQHHDHDHDHDQHHQYKYPIVNSSATDDQVLTVWKRSSMSFQGTHGFTVFDSTGRLAFRVDNYSRKDRLVLMDGSGKALFTLKPQSQILSMQNQWNGYRGEGGYDRTSRKSREELLFTMRRRSSSLIHSSSSRECEAEVFMCRGGGGGGGAKKKESCRQPTPDFKVEGSFRKRNCKLIKTSSSPCGGGGGGAVVVAKIERKSVKNTTVLLSDDVFSMTVQPGFDPQLIMAFVIILDRICPKPLPPLLCS